MPLRTIETTEGTPHFLDGGDSFATFQVVGGSKRVAYRTGYVAPAGRLRVNVTTGDDVEFVGKPYVPSKTFRVIKGTTQATLASMLEPDAMYVWDDDAEVVLTKPFPIPYDGVYFSTPRLQLAPTWDNARVGVHVKAKRYRADNAVIRGNPAHTDTKQDRGSFGSCAFTMLDGGEAVIRNAKASRIDTFLRVEGDRHLGVVVEKPTLTDHLAYAIYANSGDAGVSWWGGSVSGPGNEPWFRAIDDPKRPVRCANGYVGHVLATMPERNIGKDGFTPRDCKRWACDTAKFVNSQIRVGQDDTGVAGGGHDPEDILVFNCWTNKYIEVKRGHTTERARRIYIIGNTLQLNGPWATKPVHIHHTEASYCTGNSMPGGPAAFVNGGTGNTNLVWERNGNAAPDLTLPGTPPPPPPPVDPHAADRARLLEISAELTRLTAETEAAARAQVLRDQQVAALQQERAAINERLGQ